MTDDSAFKRRVRARMAQTGEKYTVARRMVIAQQDPGRAPVVLRVYLNPHVDLELTSEAGRAYAAADEQRRRDMAGRLLADLVEAAGFEDVRVAAGSTIVTDRVVRAEAEAAQDAVIREVVQRGVERVVGVSAVNVDRAADRLRVDVRAERPILLVGQRGAEADRLRGEMEELTGRRVQLDVREARSPQEEPGNDGLGRTG